MIKRVGGSTVRFVTPPAIKAWGNVAGKKEGHGPLGTLFDMVYEDTSLGEKTWEKAESRLQNEAVRICLDKSKVNVADVQYIFGGDLLNQCISSHYGLLPYNIPFYGTYGACSTMIETTALAAMCIDGEFADTCMAVTSSHFCSSERQFRTPLEYGGQRAPTSQWTVTGSACIMLDRFGEGPYVTHHTAGRIVDMGITDISNMGAAMAPAAIDTLSRLFEDTGTKPEDYDLILTGDLGQIGSDILRQLMGDIGYQMDGVYSDCGLMIFDRERQDVMAGGSGCGCCALVTTAYVLRQMREKKLNKVIISATGALMSTVSNQQGQSIPGISHAIILSNEKGA